MGPLPRGSRSLTLPPDESYQDYVIKDGRFVGRFEEMYRRFDDPWHQRSARHVENSYARSLTIMNLQRLGVRTLVEFGCGLGYYSNRIHASTGIRVAGIDISETAVTKARTLWPHLSFMVDSVDHVDRYFEADAILFADVTWYVLPSLNDVFRAMSTGFHGKLFFNNMPFYKGQQQYGTEYFTCLREFIDFVPFELLAYGEATMTSDDAVETSTVFRVQPK